MTIEIDPLSPEFQANPFPVYDTIRREDPVHYFERFDSWVVVRYADVVDILRDPRFIVTNLGDNQDMIEAAKHLPGLEAVLEGFRNMMLFQNAPNHTRLRGLVNKAFTPRVVERLRPRVEEIVASLLDEIDGAESADLIADFAVPLPVIVIAELLGVPAADRARFKAWSAHLAVALDGTVRMEGLSGAAKAAVELLEYLENIVAERRAEPRADLISGLIGAQEADDALSEAELLSTCVLLLIAGHETTTNLIGNGVHALLEHPTELERLRREPGLIKTAVEELLRYDSPVQTTSRYPADDLEFEGRKFRARQEINLMLGAANRDPAQFARPDSVDVGREDNHHLAFGHGAHFCIGAPLARLEGQIAIGELLRRFPKLSPGAAEPTRRSGIVLRGFTSLPVRL